MTSAPRTTWIERTRRQRARRAIERQLDYQTKKAAVVGNDHEDLIRANFVRAQVVRQRLEQIRPIGADESVLEVGSGAHGLIFGFADQVAVGIDPLAASYKRLFPKLQDRATTVAAIGEELPFSDSTFGIVLSDNVIDHAERPLEIVDEIVRVAKPGALIYFTVNVHHPVYHLASLLHGAWNAVGVKVELSAFADHTVHLTESAIAKVWQRQPVRILEQSSTVAHTRKAQRQRAAYDPDSLLKKAFYKNAVFELIAVRK